MRVATAAQNFDTFHPMARVNFSADVPFIRRCCETGPAAARIELGIRDEQFITAGDTLVYTFILRVVILAGEGSLCALLTRDPILLRRESGSPLLFSFGNFLFHLKTPAPGYTHWAPSHLHMVF